MTKRLKAIDIRRMVSPDVDPWKDNTILVFERLWNGSPFRYLYVSVRRNGLWYVSGDTQRGLTWDEMREKYLLTCVSLRLATAGPDMFVQLKEA